MEQHGGWCTFGERTVYDNRWVRLALVDVEVRAVRTDGVTGVTGWGFLVTPVTFPVPRSGVEGGTWKSGPRYSEISNGATS